jgi:uncharacterized protein (TIGR02594 family)
MSYDYLKKEKSPKILLEALKHLGVKEIVGSQHNPIILNWAEELGLEKIYKSDEIAWCGLFIAFVCHQAGLEKPFTNQQSLWALNWNKFGTKQSVAMLGDVLTFRRKSGGHVGIYVGEDNFCYHILGGNQNNSVSIVRIKKTRLSQIRRTNWKIKQPDNVRIIKLNSNGKISENES